MKDLKASLSDVFLFILTFLFLSCAGPQELHLRADGSLFSNGKGIEVSGLRHKLSGKEVTLHVDPDVPYDEVVNLMKILKANGVDKLALEINSK